MKKLHLWLKFAFICLLTAQSCKKTDIAKPQTNNATFTLDGKTYSVDEKQITTTLYKTNGDPVKAMDIIIPLNNTGASIKFFIADLKSGNISIVPKTGTSAWVNEKTSIAMQMMAQAGDKLVNANTDARSIMNSNTTVITNNGQTYVKYTISEGNSLYGISGTIEFLFDEATGKFSLSWDITFKDASGKTYNFKGHWGSDIKNITNTKPKEEIVDPTPITKTPVIESISPTTGWGDTVVNIIGTGFSETIAQNTVTFNGMQANVTAASLTKLTVKAPIGGSTGNVAVKVNNSATATGPVFTYAQKPTIISLTPNSGKPGDTIIVNGTNFSTANNENEVRFTSTAAGLLVSGIVIESTATTIKVKVPESVATGAVTATIKGQAALGTPPVFTVITPAFTMPAFKASTKMFFVDTSVVFAMNIDGSNRQAIASYPQNATYNAYIGEVAIDPFDKKVYYNFTTQYTQPFNMYSMNFDGSASQQIKTFAASTIFNNLTIWNNKILYSIGTQVGNGIQNKGYAINKDGTGEQLFQGGYIMANYGTQDGSKSVKIDKVYTTTSKTNVWVQHYNTSGVWTESNDIFITIDGEIFRTSVSHDCKYLIYMKEVGRNAGTWEIYIRDITKKDGATVKVTNLQMPQLSKANGNKYYPYPNDFTFINGNQILLSYNTTLDRPNWHALPEDYINIMRIDIATGQKLAEWKIMGRYTGSIYTD